MTDLTDPSRMDTKKRALGPGAKCCGECDLCSDQAPVEPIEPEPTPDPDPDFDWGNPPKIDPDQEDQL